MDLRENELVVVFNLHYLTALETCDLSKLIAIIIMMTSVH